MWYLNDWEGVGYPATLWQTLTQLPANARGVGSESGLWQLHLSNLITGAILLAVAVAIGVCGYWLALKHRESRVDRGQEVSQYRGEN